MGDTQRKKKCVNPTEDLERYIDEVKRDGDSLGDETLQRMIFSPGGSMMEGGGNRQDMKRGRGDGYDDDFSDALEFIREDTQRSRGSTHEPEEVDLYQDARSQFDYSSSISSPYSVLSPTMRGSIDPLSPNTSYAMDKMSRVSLSSPSAAVAVPPCGGYYPMNGQASTSHPSPLPPSSHPLSSPIPPSSDMSSHSSHQLLPSTLPPPSPLHHTLHRQIHPNGSYHPNGPSPVPYPPPMAPSPYHPQSMPLPSTVPLAGPSMHNHGMASTSSMNPLFSPYTHHPSPYSIHPYASPYPQMPYPIPQQKILPPTTSQLMTQQRQMTARMQSEYNTQKINPLPHHTSMPPPPLPNKTRQSRPSTVHPSSWKQQSTSNRPSTSTHITPNLPSTSKLPSSNIPSTSIRQPPHCNFPDISHFTPEQLAMYKREYERMINMIKEMKLRKKMERDGRGVREADTASTVHRLKKKKKTGLKPISEMAPEELEAAKKKANNDHLKMQLLAKYGEYREDEMGNVMPVEKKGHVITWKGDKRYPLPEGKDMTFYIKPHPGPRKTKSPCPSPTPKSLEYTEEVPQCKEGKSMPKLSRGHHNTKERRENKNDYGIEYINKIQSLFHSVTGDPSRVPNASTNGDKWENPFKEGEEPIGMEVYRNVRSRIWNAEYDYSLIFRQLKEISERMNGLIHKGSSCKEEKKKKERKENRSKADEVPERGYVFVSYADSDMDSGSDWEGDGRIAVGRKALKIEEERREDERKIKEKEEEKQRKEKERKDKEDYKRFTRDTTKKIRNGYYPTVMANRYWAKISYYELAYQVGIPFYCKWNMDTVYIDKNAGKGDEPNRYCLANQAREEREEKINKLLLANECTVYMKSLTGGYIILGTDSDVVSVFVQSPIYNAMMGEELDTIVRIEKGHEMIIFDENFFNLLLQQALQFGERVVFDTKQLLLTRVSFTKGWGEAYPKPTILDSLVWIEISFLNAMKKIDTVLKTDMVI